ncbi:hypothetical protein ACSFA3_20930 [Variovorax sp. RHLX14]|uniref:hypothetical protein n=1 Tax=Variovorax sp. RHLX14 TaxID=1259731 RepID=UPI003F470103
MTQDSPILSDLPAHRYGVHVENEMDARRLLYLVAKIGEEKIVDSAYKYSQKYPDRRIFVSHLLKRHGIKVPAQVFAQVNVPLYRVYLLVHPASSKVKIGYSGDWLRRAANFKCDFDLDQSIGIDFGSDKAGAIAAEKMAKSFFYWAATEPPLVPFGASGHTEWFRAIILDDAEIAISAFQSKYKRNRLTLRKALAHDLHGDRKINIQYVSRRITANNSNDIRKSCGEIAPKPLI